MSLTLIVKMPKVVGYYIATIDKKDTFKEIEKCAKKLVSVFSQELVDASKATAKDFKIFAVTND